jgi:4-diphosphocytidyl-2-C-methyl-D-erythritol kinase
MIAAAKLNLYLHITGRRDDGWHLIDSLVAFASIADEVAVAPARMLNLTIDGPFARDLGGDPRQNLVWRAATLLARRLGRSADAAVTLTKNLPVASGIGGGSSDAAACLVALAELWNCDNRPLLMEIAAALGSDVPACLAAQPVWLADIGDRVDEAGPLPTCGVVLVNPRVALPTPAVYGAFAGPYSPSARFPIPDNAVDLLALLARRRNDLTDTAIALVPEIGAVLDHLARLDSTRLVRMSGSGATCFALFADRDAAAVSAERLAKDRPDWWTAAGELSSGPLFVAP